jgi:hypothetical protein
VPAASGSDPLGPPLSQLMALLLVGVHARDSWHTRKQPYLSTCMSDSTFRRRCWKLKANRLTGGERAARTHRLCAWGAVEDELHVVVEWPAYKIAYGPSTGATLAFSLVTYRAPSTPAMHQCGVTCVYVPSRMRTFCCRQKESAKRYPTSPQSGEMMAGGKDTGFAQSEQPIPASEYACIRVLDQTRIV